MKETLLVSACLIGRPCRYDQTASSNKTIQALALKYELVPVCPEALGDLPTPRPPAERNGERVLTKDGADVTDAFRLGAQRTLELALSLGCRTAVLKARSPSCGSGEIYDGTFSGRRMQGDGVTAALLKSAGVAVLTEEEADRL